MFDNNFSRENKNISQLSKWKQTVIFLVGLFGLIIAQIVVQLIVDSIALIVNGGKNSSYNSFINSVDYSFLLNAIPYIILLAFFVFFTKPDWKELTKSFKGWKPFVAGLVGIAVIFSFNISYNVFLNILKVEIVDNSNESVLNLIVGKYPLFSLIIFANLGPICEELTYRVGLFSLVRRVNKIFAYFVTIIVFTLIHFDYGSIGTSDFINELINLPFYFVAGFTFTFLYEKYGFAGSLTAHILNNTISVLLTIVATL